MIRINLAGIGSGPSLTGLDSLGVGGADIIMAPDETRKEGLKRILIILLFPAALYAYETQNLPTIRSQLAAKTKLLADLQAFNNKTSASVEEIKKIREDEVKIQARIAMLEKLSKDRQNEIRVLDLLQQVIPEKAWFTKVEIQGTKVTLVGHSSNDVDISTLLESLSRSVFFSEVSLVSSNEQIIDGMNFKKFEIKCLTEKSQP